MTRFLLILLVSLIGLATNADPGRGGTRIGSGNIFQPNIPLTPEMIKGIFEQEVKPLLTYSLNYVEMITTLNLDSPMSKNLSSTERREDEERKRLDTIIIRTLFSPNRDIRNDLEKIVFDVKIFHGCFKDGNETDMTVSETSPNQICVNGPRLAKRLNMSQAAKELLALSVHELVHRNNEWDEDVANRAQIIAGGYSGLGIDVQANQFRFALENAAAMLTGIDAISLTGMCYGLGGHSTAVMSFFNAMSSTMYFGLFPFSRKVYDTAVALIAITNHHNLFCYNASSPQQQPRTLPELIANFNGQKLRNQDLASHQLLPVSPATKQNLLENLKLSQAYIKEILSHLPKYSFRFTP